MTISHTFIAFWGVILAQSGATQSGSDYYLDKLQTASDEIEAARHEQDVRDAWMDQGGPTVDILMERGVDALEAEDMTLARDMFDRVILIEPDYAEAWAQRAKVFFADGKIDETIADLEAAIQREPRHFEAWEGLGGIFELLENKPAALAAYREALIVHPFSTRARNGVKRLERHVDGRAL